MDCAMARSVWALLDEEMVEHITVSLCSNAKEWIFSLLQSLPHDQLIKTVITLWAIWSTRRKAIHEEFFQSPFAIFKFIGKFRENLKMISIPQRNIVAAHASRPVVPNWIPSTGDYMKINVDAEASKMENKGVVAAISLPEW
jgi:hypothetical protein